MRLPEIEVLWWEGCPSTERALAELREALADLGLERAAIKTTEIKDDPDAHAAGFTGSPTILIDGADVQPGDEESVGLTCRVYARRDGRVAPTPEPEAIRAALRSAAAIVEVDQ